MKHILIILSILLLYSPLFGQSEETCYVDADTSKEFDPTLLSNISVSLISEFLKEVEHLPPAGIPMDACVYQIGAAKVEDTTFVTFTGKNLNSYGNSKLSGPDGFQESLLNALYIALEDKRKLICDAYGEFIEKCGGVVKKIPAEKIETIREMKNKYDQLEKRIAVLDTRIERLNSGAVKVVTNTDSFENPKLDGVKKVFTDEPVVQKIEKDKTKGLFVGVGSLGTILTSTDGTTWTERTSGTSQHLNGVTYGNGLFVSVGLSGTILTSSVRDPVKRKAGIYWTKRNEFNSERTFGISSALHGFRDPLHGVTYGNGLFVTVGRDAILTSSDGIYWTRSTWTTSQYHRPYLHGVSYENGLFVTLGEYRTILTSPDGTSWTERFSGTSVNLSGATYGNGLFVTVGDYGTILTSSNGRTWTVRNSGTLDRPYGSNHLFGVTYENGLFVTVGYKGIILTSPDGTTWTERTSGISESLSGVTYGNGLFVTVGENATILTSPDGNSWTKRTSSGTSRALIGVTYSQ